MEAAGDLSGVVEVELFERSQGFCKGDLFGEAFGVGAFESGQGRPHRREADGVGGDELGKVALLDLLSVDGLFDGEAEEVRDADQFDTAFEGGELADLFEAVEVLVIGRTEHDDIEKEDDRIDGDAAGFARTEEVFEGFEGAFQEVGELEQTAIGVHQGTDRFKEIEVDQRLGEVGKGVVSGDLANDGIDVHLRFDGDDPASVALGDVVAFDLDVAEDFGVVAAVVGKKGVEDQAIARGEIAFEEVVTEVEAGGEEVLIAEALEEGVSFGAWQEEEGVIFEVGKDASIDLIAFEVGVGVEVEFVFGVGGKTEAGFFDFAFGGKDPVEAIESALGGVGVAFEGLDQGLEDRRLAGAIRSVEKEKAGVSAFANEVFEHPDDRILSVFLACDPSTFLREVGAVGKVLVKDPVALLGAVRFFKRRGAEEKDGVEEVLGGVSAEERGVLEKEFDVLAEGEDTSGLGETVLDGGGDGVKEGSRHQI